ncbi:DNA-binding GntR family transcriptional regulator [Rhodoligotrophos appendicifer]|uniref:GntR family transcriptional regulator n=1 Tax=Rhodoligotrophos appendicifer TaxID=987056 RepID=UPI00118567AF|nr:GntR family transcriptional regulator [Rhodoligotrophos appendicifer]
MSTVKSSLGTPAKAPSMANEAYARLEEMIILGKLSPDTRLSEQMLAQALGLGRTPIREALQMLRANHLVEIHPRAGVFVTRLDFRSQLLVFEVRRELEILVAGRAARRASHDQRTEFRQMARDMRASSEKGDKIWLMNVDRRFKELAIAAANNRYLAVALAPIYAHSRRFYFTHLETTNVSIALAHAAAMEAIAEGNEAGATAAARRFLAEMEEFTKAVITEELVSA